MQIALVFTFSSSAAMWFVEAALMDAESQPIAHLLAGFLDVSGVERAIASWFPYGNPQIAESALA
jgi:hypothetical protein